MKHRNMPAPTYGRQLNLEFEPPRLEGLDDTERRKAVSAVPESDKTLEVTDFIACKNIDTVYFDPPYYLTSADPTAKEALALIREGMRRKQVAALAWGGTVPAVAHRADPRP